MAIQALHRFFWSRYIATLQFHNATFGLSYSMKPWATSYVFQAVGDPLTHLRLTVHRLSLGNLTYAMYYQNDSVVQTAMLHFTEAPTEIYCSSRIIQIQTYWKPAELGARMRTRLEWLRHDDNNRECTEIVPFPTTTTELIGRSYKSRKIGRLVLWGVALGNARFWPNAIR
ncbi:unnamed protein product, partial [Mesorhabditis spiculigera]